MNSFILPKKAETCWLTCFAEFSSTSQWSQRRKLPKVTEVARGLLVKAIPKTITILHRRWCLLLGPVFESKNAWQSAETGLLRKKYSTSGFVDYWCNLTRANNTVAVSSWHILSDVAHPQNDWCHNSLAVKYQILYAFPAAFFLAYFPPETTKS